MPIRDKKIWYSVAILEILAVSISIFFTFSNPSLILFLLFFFFIALLVIVSLHLFKLPIFPYDRILSAVSTGDLSNWEKESGIRIDIAENYQVYYPKVVSLDDGWRMYYRGGGKRGGIVSAFSRDGLKWNPEPGFRVNVECCANSIVRVEGCEVIKNCENSWRLYYSATDGNRWRIYLCHSNDGLYWDNHSLCINTPNNDEYQGVKAPSIVYSNGIWKMFFMRFFKSNIRIYTSFSTDGISWSKMSECVGICSPLAWVRNPFVISNPDGTLRMFFSEREYSSDPLNAKIMSAVSSDGIHWHREEGVRIASGTGYDRHGIFNVDIVPIETGYRMYYTGYWGRHLLEPLTLRYYRKRRE